MKKKIYFIIKRIFDIITAILGIIFLIPIYIVVAVIIKLETKGKVIYKQKRVGKKGKIIEIYKFRTMVENADEMIKELPKELKQEYQENYKIEKDPRITKIGKILRYTNIDELPQMINVLKGEMSIIGVRPILEKELSKYSKQEQRKLLKMNPGITGYWQVNRNKCKNYQDRINMELYYIENHSLMLDLKILLKTYKLLLKGIIRKN